MNSPSRVISFVNAAHFIDHYAMLIFAAAVIIMGPALGMAYSELLPYATPGFVADSGLASQLAEVGVILLMFGVGLHFSVKDLVGVKGIAIPGAVGLDRRCQPGLIAPQDPLANFADFIGS